MAFQVLPYAQNKSLLDPMSVNKMSPEKCAKSSLELPRRPSTRQWLPAMLIGATLLLAGKWAASQNQNGCTYDVVLDYMKNTVEGHTAEPHSSTLTEPWSHVSEPTHVFCYHIYCSQICMILIKDIMLYQSRVRS